MVCLLVLTKLSEMGEKSVPFMRPAVPHQPWIAMLTCSALCAYVCVCIPVYKCMHGTLLACVHDHPRMYFCLSVCLCVCNI